MGIIKISIVMEDNMGIKEKDGYKFYDGLDECIVIEEHRIDEYINYINNKDIRAIGFNCLFYNLEDIDFLEKCPNIEEVNIYSPEIKDFSGLYRLKKLLKLTISGHEFGEIDFDKLKSLEQFIGECNKYLKELYKCISLKSLSLNKYKSINKNLEELMLLNKLERLQIIQSQIISLNGIENLKNLNNLDFYRLPKLEYLDGLEELSERLKILRFESCKKIKNHEYVTCLKELEVLAFNNCKEMESIEFIREMPNLKKFMFVDTNIVDGDLSPCIGLEYAGFFDKKHYSHKFKELNDKKYWK
jgi:hypothetical protein